jgi:hypothetical protein
VSQAWKCINDNDRMEWEEKARQDKARFQVEKSRYAGPWRVPRKKRKNLDAKIPRRPMSAFLAFSHTNRAEEKRKNPHLSNNQITRILAKQWKDAPDDQKKIFIDQEYALRQKYLENITTWRHSQKEELLKQRQRREEMALKEVVDMEKHAVIQDVEYRSSSLDQSDDYSSRRNHPWSSYYCQDPSEPPTSSYESRYPYRAEASNYPWVEYGSYSNFHHSHPYENFEHNSYPHQVHPNYYYPSSSSSFPQGSRFQEGILHYYPPAEISSECYVGSSGYQGRFGHGDN